jgi:hypothetical protein
MIGDPAGRHASCLIYPIRGLPVGTKGGSTDSGIHAHHDSSRLGPTCAHKYVEDLCETNSIHLVIIWSILMGIEIARFDKKCMPMLGSPRKPRILRELKKLDRNQGGISVPIKMPMDDDGYFDRRCPSVVCLSDSSSSLVNNGCHLGCHAHCLRREMKALCVWLGLRELRSDLARAGGKILC